MIRPLLLAALIALPGLAAAQDQTESGTAPQRIRSLTLKAGEKCPPSTDNDIVVCSTLDQPYRIPKQFRDDAPIAAKNQSWVNRTATMDQVGRVAGGLPDTCSPIGAGGQTGCALATNRAWAAERRAQRDAESTVP
jgi:hypothetical protein